MFRFETLDIWKMGISYCEKILDVADEFPQKVQFSLGSQLRSSSLSISNNIAEGSGSHSKQEFRSFLNFSIRSTYETVSALFIAKNKSYITKEKFSELYAEGEVLAKKIRAFRACIQ